MASEIVHIDGLKKKVSEKRYNRLEEIARMMVKGKRSKDIADRFGISKRQVRKDKELIREMEENQLREQVIVDVIQDVMRSYPEAMRELWDIIDNTPNDFAKLQAIEDVFDLPLKLLNKLSKLGLNLEQLDQLKSKSDIQLDTEEEQDRVKKILQKVKKLDEEDIKELS